MSESEPQTAQRADGAGYGPEDIEVGDEVVFTYGPKGRKSRKTVREIVDWGVKIEGGGTVAYRDIVNVNPSGRGYK